MIYTSTTESEVKNITTPRTLADCEFTTGHAGINRDTDYSPTWYAVMCVVAIVAVVVISLTA